MIPKLTPLVVALAVGAGCAAGAVGYLAHLKAKAHALEAQLSQTRSALETQQAQTRVVARSGQISEQRAAATLQTERTAEVVIHEVNNAPDLDAALAAYLAGLERLRDETSPHAGADDIRLGQGGGSAADAAGVPAAGPTETQRR